MRLAYSCMMSTLVIAGCGTTTTPSAETDADDTSSTAVTYSSNDAENTTVPITTVDTSSSDSGTTSTETTGTDEATGPTTGSSETTSQDTSSSEASSDSGESDSSTTGELLPPCTAGCMTEFACSAEWKSAEACVTWCEANLIEAASFSQFCEIAWENLSACFGELSCEEYAEYLEPTMFPYPCAIESDSLMFECEGQ